MWSGRKELDIRNDVLIELFCHGTYIRCIISDVQKCISSLLTRNLIVTGTVACKDGRLGSRLRGYHPVAPRPLRYGPFVHRL
jgi:hypothetical protein